MKGQLHSDEKEVLRFGKTFLGGGKKSERARVLRFVHNYL